ncbi:MAG: flagellar assembly protein FliX [Alphaproteobacteria bacterium]|nr:MAG: flagellar assembly protein FliX [Alphaproteobacteria bacterium]
MAAGLRYGRSRGKVNRIMKVGGPGRTSSTSGAKGKKGASGSGHKFSISEETVEPAATANVSSSSPVNSIDALMALQGVDENNREKNRKAVAKGRDLLEKLEEIRHGLLIGNLSAQKLMQLKDSLASINVADADPELAEIVHDIEVRAAVELAKYGY